MPGQPPAAATIPRVPLCPPCPQQTPVPVSPWGGSGCCWGGGLSDGDPWQLPWDAVTCASPPARKAAATRPHPCPFCPPRTPCPRRAGGAAEAASPHSWHQEGYFRTPPVPPPDSRGRCWRSRWHRVGLCPAPLCPPPPPAVPLRSPARLRDGCIPTGSSPRPPGMARHAGQCPVPPGAGCAPVPPSGSLLFWTCCCRVILSEFQFIFTASASPPPPRGSLAPRGHRVPPLGGEGGRRCPVATAEPPVARRSSDGGSGWGSGCPQPCPHRGGRGCHLLRPLPCPTRAPSCG